MALLDDHYLGPSRYWCQLRAVDSAISRQLRDRLAERFAPDLGRFDGSFLSVMPAPAENVRRPA